MVNFKCLFTNHWKTQQDILEMRQLYESDRKPRTISFLKHSQIFLKEIEDAAKAREERTAIQEVIFRAESLYADMSFMPTENDVSVTFYVTGYCCDH